MKCYFFEFVFDSFKIPQISKHVFLLRSTFVIEDFDEYSILVFKLWFLTFFRAEGPRFRLHFVSKNPLQKCAGKNYFFTDGLFYKMVNDESWPQQKHILFILQNLHKAKMSF